MAELLTRLALIRTSASWVLRKAPCVFMLHRVLPRTEASYDPEMVTSVDLFADFLEWVAESYRVTRIEEFCTRTKETNNAEKPCCAITFDDGWLDNYLYAFPQLQQRKMPATIFLPTNFIGTNRRFWQEKLWLCLEEIDKQENRETLLMRTARRFPWFISSSTTLATYSSIRSFLMTRPSHEALQFVEELAEQSSIADDSSCRSFVNWGEVREMQREGISVGSHTVSHSLLPRMTPRDVIAEIENSRAELNARLADDVRLFSYPWGAWNGLVKQSVQSAGYDFAFTTKNAPLSNSDDPRLLPRIAISNSVLSFTNGVFNPTRALYSVSRKAWKKSKLAPNTTGCSEAKRVKIALVIDQVDSWQGGTEQHLKTLVASLDREFFEPQIFCLVRCSRVADRTFPCPVQYVCASAIDRLSPLKKLLCLRRMLKTFCPDIVQTFFFEGTLYGFSAALGAGVRRIVGTTRNTAPRSKSQRIALKIVQKVADHWVCNSQGAWNYEMQFGSVAPNQLEILPNAVDLSRFVPATAEQRTIARCSLGLSRKDLVVVCVANFRSVKDLPTLLEAIRKVRLHRSSTFLLLLGEGPEEAVLRQTAHEKELDDVVKFLGTKAEVWPYLAAADIGVLTSRSEGSSNSVLEYMAMGLPAVLSDIPPNRNLASGLFFAPGDSEDLKDKILHLSSECNLRRSLSVSYREAAAQYSMDKFRNRAQGLYNGLMCQTL